LSEKITSSDRQKLPLLEERAGVRWKKTMSCYHEDGRYLTEGFQDCMTSS